MPAAILLVVIGGDSTNVYLADSSSLESPGADARPIFTMVGRVRGSSNAGIALFFIEAKQGGNQRSRLPPCFVSYE